MKKKLWWNFEEIKKKKRNLRKSIEIVHTCNKAYGQYAGRRTCSYSFMDIQETFDSIIFGKNLGNPGQSRSRQNYDKVISEYADVYNHSHIISRWICECKDCEGLHPRQGTVTLWQKIMHKCTKNLSGKNVDRSNYYILFTILIQFYIFLLTSLLPIWHLWDQTKFNPISLCF